MAQRAFDEYSGYMVQRVAVVGGEMALSAEVDVDNAIGFLSDEGGSDPDLLRTTLLDAIRPADLMVDDKRREYDWGASGPLVHELVITVALGIPVGVVSAALYDCLRAALRRIHRREDAPGTSDLTDDDAAWETFAAFIEFAMRANRVRLEELERRPNHWYAKAKTERGMVEGIVAGEGIVAARLVREGRPPLSWPPPVAEE